MSHWGVFHLCPLGWHDGRLLKSRGSSEADIIKWLYELRELVGIEPSHEWQRDETDADLKRRQAEWDAMYKGDGGMGQLSIDGYRIPPRPTE